MDRGLIVKRGLLSNLKDEPNVLEEFETILVTATLLDYNISFGHFGKESAKGILDSNSESVFLIDMKTDSDRICLDFSFTNGKLDRICCCKNEMRADCHKVNHGSNKDAIQKMKEYL